MDCEAVEATTGKQADLTTKLSVEQLDRQVTAHASPFDRRDAVQAVADLLPNGALAPEVESVSDAFLASDAVVVVSETATRSARASECGVEAVERYRIEHGVTDKHDAFGGEPPACRADGGAAQVARGSARPRIAKGASRTRGLRRSTRLG